ncbi:tRNA lysidine(34) synthetase TilS [Anaerocolumna chitinilytica]|uniref:tRNA(Ile)-lysidine synthase n=1 Tax=Anaerocolumna chitinilytica TaxID=1727145 RepID=A0A7M3SAQ0_9FIRM|nr:tRNA lysidine(34) synthetase TilS [Anaerocolumna chitinilytica]BCK01668.1 tRNA(Ile)-lysidine synthase [Anaerocolumna chitinilytica]
MINKVKQYIENYKMLEKGDQIIVGVSGGADSVCLFHVLLELRKEYELTLHVIHINHGIRGEEAKRDEEFVRELCKKEEVSFQVVHKDIPLLAKEGRMSVEEAGRKARYEVFNQYFLAYKCNKIAIAHNKNDTAETILFHMFRGSGLSGLTGISPVRDRIIRPLLCLERKEIESYLFERGISYLDDSTNFTLDYTRNKIRLKVLKEAEGINSKAVSHIAMAGETFRELQEYVEKSVIKAAERILVKGTENEILLQIEELSKEDVVIQKEIVRKAFFMLSESLKDIDAYHITSVLQLIKKQPGRRIDLPYGITAMREYNHIELRTKGKDLSKDLEPRELLIPGVTPLFEEGKSIKASLLNYKKNMIIPQSICTKWFDYDKIKDTVLIRCRKQGDYLCIDKGGTKKLKALLIDEKIPRQKRDILPLLADGSHIMWVIGNRISEAYKVDENTRRILQITITEEEENE